jgi:hypothetical protein
MTFEGQQAPRVVDIAAALESIRRQPTRGDGGTGKAHHRWPLTGRDE